MQQAIEAIKKYIRAANYLTAIQIYLWDNFLLRRKLNFDDIKPRLLTRRRLFILKKNWG